MRIVPAGGVLLLLTLSALSQGAARQDAVGTRGSKTQALPYYDSADFTPRWQPAAHRVGEFRLTDSNGQTLDSRSLQGHLVVVSFFFTSCPSVCPTLVEKLRRVQSASAEWPEVRLVSFSVTPETDTPAVLRQFARGRGIDSSRWHLLTGDRATIQRLFRESYFADDRREIGSGGSDRLLHTERVLLVDGEGHLRGVYNGSQGFEIERLIQDVQVLRSAGRS